MEKYEEWNQCAKREILEECGIEIDINSTERIKYVKTFNSMRLDKGYHAISVIMYCKIDEYEKKKIKNKEPDKCDKWIWTSYANLKNKELNLFYPLQDFVRNHRQINSSEDLLTYMINSSSSTAYSNKKVCLESNKSTPNESNDSTFEEDYFITKEDFNYDIEINNKVNNYKRISYFKELTFNEDEDKTVKFNGKLKNRKNVNM